MGGPIVFSHLALDLQVAAKTVKHWITVFERMYMVFIVPPYSGNLARSIQKAPKVHFYDHAEVNSENKGMVFENLVAQHLLKRILKDFAMS